MFKQIRLFIHKWMIWYSAGNRWWIAPIAGILFSLCQPPFNHETHPTLVGFPFLSFLVVVPLLLFSIEPTTKRAFQNTYLFGITASLSTFYWIANVMVDGLWPVIMAGLGLMTLIFGLIFPLYGLLCRYVRRRFPSGTWLLFPALWVVVEYGKTLTEISFPWAFLGYAMVPILPFAQAGALTGVYGISFFIVAVNTILFEMLVSLKKEQPAKKERTLLITLAALFVMITLWGQIRLSRHGNFEKKSTLSLIQNNIDQAHWNGNRSLDTAMTITEKMVYKAGAENPDLIIFPESGIYCYLERQWRRKLQVIHWYDSLKTPLLIGTLHFERGNENPHYKYSVYNAVLLLDSSNQQFKRYFKINLVPFSETLPFEGIFPLLSRVNLGESDFSRGKEETVFNVNNTDLKCAPFICYEIIYPNYVRRRVTAGANLLVNVTNDGWFGKSTAPFHHATMARMRAIENGVSLARCANSGISMFVDPVGRVIEKSKLYTRAVLTQPVPIEKIPTLYRLWGDWVVYLSLVLVFGSLLFSLVAKLKIINRDKS